MIAAAPALLSARKPSQGSQQGSLLLDEQRVAVDDLPPAT